MPQSIFRPNAGLTGLPGGGGGPVSQLGRVVKQPQWVIAGQFVTFEEFTQELFPDDTPGRTRFLLKYTGEPE
jgi:hypothetical protein